MVKSTSAQRAQSHTATRSLPAPAPSTDDIERIHKHCAVYTEPRVAEAILDRINWTSSADLRGRNFLEPACGDGSFLLPAIHRLLASLQHHRACDEAHLLNAIVAFEFDFETAHALKAKIEEILKSAGLTRAAAKRVSSAWLRCEDFLLAQELPLVSDVAGNPPYMRWSKIPETLRRSYEAHLPAFAAKGDLCLAFVCRAAALLRAESARLAFLCADRWLRCAYGAPARVELERSCRLSLHVEVHDVPVFTGSRKVGAYAAISILDRERRGEAVVAHASSIDDLCKRLQPGAGIASASSTSRLTGNGGAILAGADLTSLFTKIVGATPLLSEIGIEVRCGMALGHTPAFVLEGPTEVEIDRQVPWVKTSDLFSDGTVKASAALIDVWDERGNLVDLEKYPRLKEHLAKYKKLLSQRTCVKTPAHWYRTIDRLDHARMNAAKILVAGMSHHSRVALSRGGAQASNAIYAVTSQQWPLAAVYAAFRIGALDLFATVLSPRFAGGVKRFDGNVLRQVRLPRWEDLSEDLRQRILSINVSTATPSEELLSELYGISSATHRRAMLAAIRRD